MHRTAKTSRFLIDLSSGGEFADSESLTGRDSLLHHIVVSGLANAANSLQFFNQLGHRLIRFAEHALGLRDMGALEEVSLVLMNLPIAYAREIGQYYQALVINRNGQKYEALSLLQTVADEAPLRYRARAIQSLGGVHHELGQLDEALRLYPDASRAASPEHGRDLLTTLLVNLDISCIKSEMGDHRGALADYENLSPLVRIVARQNPLYFYLYHNELAIEFAELGRLAEAEAACAIALASPFAPAYPEWSDTRDEIAAKRKSASPSVVAIHRVPEADRTHEAHRATEVDRARKAALATQAESQRKPEPSKGLAFRCPASKRDSFQRSTITIPARTTFNAISILDRVLICVGPRAPPSLS